MTVGPPPVRGVDELGTAARSSVLTLFGATASAGLGFLLVVVMARLLGVADTGVALQAIAVFSIAMAVTRLGSDTTAMWLLPRLRNEDVERVPAGLAVVLTPPLVVAAAVAVAWSGAVYMREQPVFGAEVDRALSVMAPLLPAATVMVTALAATRAFGGVVPFNMIHNIAVPAGRMVAIPMVVALGGAVSMAAGAWAVVFLPAVLAALYMLFRMARVAMPAGSPVLAVPSHDLARRAAVFGLPRTVSAAAEQANLWLAVVLVGIVAGAEAAGSYGVAARFVGAGVIVATAVRIAVAPRFSGLLGQGRTHEVQILYSVTARWVLLFGAPIYVVLAVNASTVLGWLGEGFAQAGPAMVILCLGSVALLAAGNVQSLLLMSGGSGRAAVNKLFAVAVLTAGTLLLVPRLGITGAAIAWSLATLLDTSLAAMQVRRRTGIALKFWEILALLAVVVAVVGGPSLLAVWLLGQGPLALVTGAIAAGLGLLIVLVLGRRPLHVGELVGVFARR